ncbi:hypothetical protein FHR38_002882 [Micromonospora polyrhachis]|uniref:Uncharacterized protein n=1 Tax=Micromonospora polyrhachis TaxID=1282883 RepID=A0A7W7WPV9_9ACTN|nr:hypothetical protein [Micromonospora polyrhachis]
MLGGVGWHRQLRKLSGPSSMSWNRFVKHQLGLDSSFHGRSRYERSGSVVPGLGRRGLVEEQVYVFVRRVVDQLIARNAVEDGLREEDVWLKQALRAWQSQQAGPSHCPT